MAGDKTNAWGTWANGSRSPLALILADDPHADLSGLTVRRTKAALPFGGKYRLIDLLLSNCINSGIEAVGVIGQYQSRSLTTHLAYGRPWGLDRKGALTLLLPYQRHSARDHNGGIDWYMGTADAIHRNQDFVLHSRADVTLVLSAGEVHNVDLVRLIRQHQETGADLTVAVVPAVTSALSQHCTLTIDGQRTVRAFGYVGSGEPGQWEVIGVLLFSAEAMCERLREDARRYNSAHDLVGDVLPRMIQAGDRVMAFQHSGYWNRLKSAEEYWQASMDLVDEPPKLGLEDKAWPIYTRPDVRPPARILPGASVSQSLICEGCAIEGMVEHSILSPGVYVAPGAVIRNAVVMHDAHIGECARVENAVLDMEVIVSPRARVGAAHRRAPTLAPSQPNSLAVLERGARVPTEGVIEPSISISGWYFPAQVQTSTRAQLNVG
jgi:glucose-1-phosphate adenylyltransferase